MTTPTHTDTRTDNFTWMLASMAVLLFALAVSEQLLRDFNTEVINVALAITLLVGIWSLRTSATWQRLRGGMSLLMLAVLGTDLLVDASGVEVMNLALFIILLLGASWITARQVLFPGRVNANIIVGAMLLYLLMGLLWAIVYLLLEQVSPGAIGGLDGDNWQANMQTIIYYSFVTLSTLGYGDLVPQQPITQYLAYMEAIIGQFYLSVLVASLVSAGLSNQGK